MLREYLEGQLLLTGAKVDRQQLEVRVKELVDKSYVSMLDDENTVRSLEAVKPLLISEK